MSEPIQHFVGRRQPPLEATIFSDGTADPLPPAATAAFSMRAVGSSTLKITNAAAVVVSEALNTVRYDWAAADVDTEGWYLGWWRVTAAGQDTDTPEFLIQIAAHEPTLGYVELEELRSTLEIRESTTADKDILLAIEAASAVVDNLTGRTFTAAAADTRLYTPISEEWLEIDHVDAVTSVTVNGTVWVEGTDFYLDTQMDMLHTLGGKRFHRSAQAVEITADFGFASVPAEIRQATTIIATQMLNRARTAPFGVLALTLDGSAIRIGRTDPQVDLLLAKWRRTMLR